MLTFGENRANRRIWGRFRDIRVIRFRWKQVGPAYIIFPRRCFSGLREVFGEISAAGLPTKKLGGGGLRTIHFHKVYRSD